MVLLSQDATLHKMDKAMRAQSRFLVTSEESQAHNIVFDRIPALDLKAQLHKLIRLGYLNITLNGSLENQTDYKIIRLLSTCGVLPLAEKYKC